MCGCASLWSPGGEEPWLPGCASLLHLSYETFGVGLRDLSELTMTTHTIEFGSSPGSGGRVSYFAADMEPAVDAIVFKSKDYYSKPWPQQSYTTQLKTDDDTMTLGEETDPTTTPVDLIQQPSTRCKDDEDCSLNGICTPAGSCRCDLPWKGIACAELGFRPSKNTGSLVPHSSSWGGSIVAGLDGRFHGFFSRISSVFNISDGDIVHGSASEVEGPYTFDAEPVGRGEGPEIVMQKLSNGAVKYVLFTSPDGHQRQFGSIQVADKIEGPYQDVPGGFPLQPAATCFDAAPLWHNDTWFLKCQPQSGGAIDNSVVIYSARGLSGPWTVWSNSTPWQPPWSWATLALE